MAKQGESFRKAIQQSEQQRLCTSLKQASCSHFGSRISKIVNDTEMVAIDVIHHPLLWCKCIVARDSFDCWLSFHVS